MRITRPAALVVYFLLTLIPVAFFGIHGPGGAGFVPGLKRLAPFPPNLAPNTFRRVGQWFSDRVGMRYPLIDLGDTWQNVIWDLRIRRDVLFGTHPWLFWNDSERPPASGMLDVRGRLRLTGEQIASLDHQMTQLKQRFDACGKTMLYFIAPNKQSIYPEELRPGWGYVPSRLDDLLAHLDPSARSIMVDPRPELRASKWRDDLPIYTRTDTHWNGIGGFIGYQVLVRALGGKIEHPELASWDRYNVQVHPFDGGDIVERILLSTQKFTDQFVILTPRTGPAFPATSNENGFWQVFRNPNGRGKVMILGDSFSPSLGALLVSHFSNVSIVDRTAVQKLGGDIVDQGNFDIVISEVVERNLPYLLDDAINLGRLCHRP